MSALRSLATGSIVAGLTLAIFLLARRATGDITSPLQLAWLIPTAAVLVAWTWLVRLIRLTTPDIISRKVSLPDFWFNVWLPSLVVLCFAIALSFPGASLVDWLIWFTALAAVLAGPQRLSRAVGRSAANARQQRRQQLVQDLKRFRGADGRDSIRGTLTAEFFPGQRTAMLCAAFCPPFEFLPQVTARSTSNEFASVKLAQLLHNGIQLEVRLPRAATVRQVVAIELQAAEPQPG